ncbi:fungal-specific transcription factor domain-containing protein [Echria macrotheca]|uniref:Fungal-specific transcription factor domain-containing protein n=1 Tax=Echria macrotheca TaxID=438768 RepID=A0AAJ0FE54_9PEZI|nr:fungal-specific transcription factor domain-containing protein [Echria macrotheca]
MALLTGKSRSSDGCWTCRLRRKKCDEVRPVCKACDALEIDCLYGDQKPEWMDGAERQKEKAEWLKLEVKRKAGQRRERRYLQMLEHGVESLNVSQLEEHSDQEDETHHHSPHDSASSAYSTQPRGSMEPSAQHSEQSLMSTLTSPAPPSDTSAGPAMGIDERELNMVMLYLDYVFPFLFPFYRPRLVDAGRGWLLVLFSRNKALLHTVLSLASYFFNIVFSQRSQAGIEDSPACVTHNWDELQRQQEIALKELQAEMQRIIARGVAGYLAETNRVMASVIQLLMFDVAVANLGAWVMHLDAATEIFLLIFKEYATSPPPDSHPCFISLLIALGVRPFSYTPKGHPWSADQASLRFSTALLLTVDTLSATTLQRVPRLYDLHQHLLTEPDEAMRAAIPDGEKEYVLPHINIKEFVGIHNWVLLSLGEIAALDAWKKEHRCSGTLSIPDLVSRGAMIECALRRHLAALDLEDPRGEAGASEHDFPLLAFIAQPGQTDTARLAEMSVWMTRIWGQALLTYLSVVVSGWQASSVEIRTSVALTIKLLRAVPQPSGGCMRTLVWPISVTGCMAALEEEASFREIAAAMGPLRTVGAMSQALSIMEHVWANRAAVEADPEAWDFAVCFNCLGFPALLV